MDALDTIIDYRSSVENEFALIEHDDMELQLDLDEEERALDLVGLDLDLDPVASQTPDWVLMCSIMNGEDIDDDTDDR